MGREHIRQVTTSFVTLKSHHTMRDIQGFIGWRIIYL